MKHTQRGNRRGYKPPAYLRHVPMITDDEADLLADGCSEAEQERIAEKQRAIAEQIRRLRMPTRENTK